MLKNNAKKPSQNVMIIQIFFVQKIGAGNALSLSLFLFDENQKEPVSLKQFATFSNED